jgi:hypothetical protein
MPTAPRTGQAAIDYAAGRVGGAMPDTGLCLQFTRQNYEVPSRYYSAIDAWYAAAEPHPDDRNPPPSAPVWFWSSSPYRHVAFHLGDGQYATTYNDEIRRYPLASMESIYGPLIGWAPDINDYSVRPPGTPTPTPPPTRPPEITMQHLIQVEFPNGTVPYYLIDYAAGTAQRIWQGIQLDLIRRDDYLDDVGSLQPPTVLDGLKVTGE